MPSFDRWIASPDPLATRRMASTELTRGLTRPVTPVGPCHCGAGNVLLFPEKRINPKSGQLALVGYHCMVCRCDEHTPEAHARWSPAARKGNEASATTTQPGCGRSCNRGGLEALAVGAFPTFAVWRKTHGEKVLRDKYGILAHNPITGVTTYNARGMAILHIPDIRNCGCTVCREEKRS